MPEGESGNRGKVESPKIKIKVIKEIVRKGAEEYQSMPRDNHRIQPETKGTKMMANYLMPKEKEVSKEKKNFSTSKRASEENGMKGKEIKATAPLWMNQKNAQQKCAGQGKENQEPNGQRARSPTSIKVDMFKKLQKWRELDDSSFRNKLDREERDCWGRIMNEGEDGQ